MVVLLLLLVDVVDIDEEEDDDDECKRPKCVIRITDAESAPLNQYHIIIQSLQTLI